MIFGSMTFNRFSEKVGWASLECTFLDLTTNISLQRRCLWSWLAKRKEVPISNDEKNSDTNQETNIVAKEIGNSIKESKLKLKNFPPGDVSASSRRIFPPECQKSGITQKQFTSSKIPVSGNHGNPIHIESEPKPVGKLSQSVTETLICVKVTTTPLFPQQSVFIPVVCPLVQAEILKLWNTNDSQDIVFTNPVDLVREIGPDSGIMENNRSIIRSSGECLGTENDVNFESPVKGTGSSERRVNIEADSSTEQTGYQQVAFPVLSDGRPPKYLSVFLERSSNENCEQESIKSSDTHDVGCVAHLQQVFQFAGSGVARQIMHIFVTGKKRCKIVSTSEELNEEAQQPNSLCNTNIGLSDPVNLNHGNSECSPSQTPVPQSPPFSLKSKYSVDVEILHDIYGDRLEGDMLIGFRRSPTIYTEMLVKEIVSSISSLTKFSSSVKDTMDQLNVHIGSISSKPSEFSDVLASVVILFERRFADLLTLKGGVRMILQGLLESNNVDIRLERILELLKIDIKRSETQSEIHRKLDERISEFNKEYMLKEQMKVIGSELRAHRRSQWLKELSERGRVPLKDDNVGRDWKDKSNDSSRESTSNLDQDSSEYIDEKDMIIAKLEQKINRISSHVSPEVLSCVKEEMMKLNSLDRNNQEFAVVRNYIGWITDIPFGKYSEDNRSIKAAHRLLDADHYGMDEVKERVLEMIAVDHMRLEAKRIIQLSSPIDNKMVPPIENGAKSAKKKLKNAHSRYTSPPLGSANELKMTTSLANDTDSSSAKVLLLVGPPGVGKTSIGKSIARCMNRKFIRISLGGVYDVSEIKGHRRTYVGAMPGKIIQSLKRVGTMNPLILIDEIDKLGRGHHGCPSSALLEVLDREQNTSFVDQFLDIPIDISKVLFVCTANTTDEVSSTLLDRMEILRVSAYDTEEKVHIAKGYLIPRAAKDSGWNVSIETQAVDDMTSNEHNKITEAVAPTINFKESAIRSLIKGYCREAGVRSLQLSIEKIFRKMSRLYSEQNEIHVPRNDDDQTPSVVCNDVTSVDRTNEHANVFPSLVNPVAPQRKLKKKSPRIGKNIKNNGEHDNISHVDGEIAVTKAETGVIKVESLDFTVTEERLASLVGKPVFRADRMYNEETISPGVVMGLAWTSLGGQCLYTEVVIVRGASQREDCEVVSGDNPDKRDSKYHQSMSNIVTTGHIGTVMNESSKIAVSVAKNILFERSPPALKTMSLNQLHLHFPSGAVPKDGPSAGVTICTGLCSASLGISVCKDLAMTGELSLSGLVLPVGGIKEKVLAARRVDIKRIIIPFENERDIEELPDHLKSGVNFLFVSKYSEVFNICFPGIPGGPNEDSDAPARQMIPVVDTSKSESECLMK